MPLSDRSPETVTVGQPVPATDQAQYLINAVNEALAGQVTSYRDTSPVPLIGTAPPVPQPGRTAMSQGATDASTMMLAGGITTFFIGGGVSLVLWASQVADPTVCAIVFAAPTTLVLALSRLLKRAKDVVEAAPPVIHQTYSGPVTQDSRQISTKTTGVFARTRNQTNR